MQNYEIFLCEDYWKIEPDENGKSVKRPYSKLICEIGSSLSNSLGKAIDPVFYTKIDGTHELSFSLPKYYHDEETGERVLNELTNLLVNKSKVLLRKIDDDEEFYLVVNSRTDTDADEHITYSYVCNDAFIEELSKTGYNLIFDVDAEKGSNGYGTIEELTEAILEGSDWTYGGTVPEKLHEYKTELEYKLKQQRYDTVYKPVPVHPIKYIPELKRYCSKTTIQLTENEYINGIEKAVTRDVYCYEDTEQITANSVKNLIYNGDEFLDTSGWTSYRIKDGKVEDGLYLGSIKTKSSTKSDNNGPIEVFSLKIPKTKDAESYMILNDTAADSNKTISADQPYLLKIQYANTDKGGDYRSAYNGINSFNIYRNNPISNPKLNPDYSLFYKVPEKLQGQNHIDNRSIFLDTRYYVIKTNQSFTNPYISIGVAANKGDLAIESIQLFELKAKADEDVTPLEGPEIVEEHYLELLSKLANGYIINENGYICEFIENPNATEGFQSNVIDDKRNYLKIICLPEKPTLNVYTHKKTMYFTRDNWDTNNTHLMPREEDTITYHRFDTTIKPAEKEIVHCNALPEFEDLPDLVEQDMSKNWQSKYIYKPNTEDRYYQYYYITYGGQFGGAWDMALLGEGVEDKRRTLIAEKSNRFNLIQELAELFKAWSVFEVTRDKNTGRLTKKVSFRENAIRTNFSGFHKGVNLKSLERKVESDDIVTKLFVENVTNEHTDSGLVTITQSSLNYWGEPYYYNFRYYVDQGLCKELSYNDANELKPTIENDLQKLYDFVAERNQRIFELEDELVQVSYDLERVQVQLKSLNMAIASAKQKRASLEAELKNINSLPKTEQDALEVRIETNSKSLDKYEAEKNSAEIKKTSLEADKEGRTNVLRNLQREKEEEISMFEQTYAQFIKEGVWSDSSYVDNNTYYLDSQQVSNTSAMPKISWTISVIDGSVLEELKDFKVKVGDQTILIDNDFFDDYENGKEHVFEVLISGIKEHLDDGTKNEIEVRNYLTSFEDLFQRVAAATQTVELNEQTYNKAKNFTNDGKIDPYIFQNTLLSNGLVLSNASDNSFKLDAAGLFLQNIINPGKKLRIVSDGIFISNSTNRYTGEPEWKTGITADGINASVLTAGEINTALIKIYSEGQPNQHWNALGITSYQIDNGKVNSNKFIRFDNFGFYFVNDDHEKNWNFHDDGSPWFEDLGRERAIEQIYENALLSITKKGFRLNLSNQQDISGDTWSYQLKTERVAVGYLGEVDTSYFTYDAYGLEIRGDFKYEFSGLDPILGQTSIRFSTDGNNYIGDWEISPGAIENNSNGRMELTPEYLSFSPLEGWFNARGKAHYSSNGLSIEPADDSEENLYKMTFSIDSGGGLNIRYNKDSLFTVNKDSMTFTGEDPNWRYSFSGTGPVMSYQNSPIYSWWNNDGKSSMAAYIQRLRVEEVGYFVGNIYTEKNLSVTGSATITNGLTVKNGLTVSNGLTITSSGLSVTGNVNITGSFSIKDGFSVWKSSEGYWITDGYVSQFVSVFIKDTATNFAEGNYLTNYNGTLFWGSQKVMLSS